MELWVVLRGREVHIPAIGQAVEFHLDGGNKPWCKSTRTGTDVEVMDGDVAELVAAGSTVQVLELQWMTRPVGNEQAQARLRLG